MELEPWRQEVDAVGKEVLGSSRVTLNRSWCTTGECNLGSWVCDGFLEEVLINYMYTQNYVLNVYISSLL